MKNKQLYVDCCEGSCVSLVFNESNNGKLKFRGKLQEAEAVNKNQRMYPFDVLDENVKILNRLIKEGGSLLGELDHPSDSIVHFANTSHRITKLWWEGKILMGEGEILSTPAGKVLQALINDGVRIGMSSRGVGQGATNENGILVIGEGYKLITFDAVADPSTHSAYQERVSAPIGKTHNENIERKPANRNSSAVKNESTGIDSVSQHALVACIGQIIKSKVEQA